jgi:O-antigen biosynthesis protein
MVIPNFLPKFFWADKGKRDKYNKGTKPRILWAGSASHIGKGGDLEFIIPLIKKTKDEFEWVFFGTMPGELIGKYEFIPWSDFYSYPHVLDSIDADIAICPISDNKFNCGKSDLKMLEYSAVGLPAVYSSIGSGIGPYDMIEGLCCVQNKEELWYGAITQMVNDASKRKEYLEAGQTELSKRWLEDDANINIYRNLYV